MPVRAMGIKSGIRRFKSLAGVASPRRVELIGHACKISRWSAFCKLRVFTVVLNFISYF